MLNLKELVLWRVVGGEQELEGWPHPCFYKDVIAKGLAGGGRQKI